MSVSDDWSPGEEVVVELIGGGKRGALTRMKTRATSWALPGFQRPKAWENLAASRELWIETRLDGGYGVPDPGSGGDS